MASSIARLKPAGTVRYATAACSMGALLVAATPKGICAIFLGDRPDALASELQRRFPQAEPAFADHTLRRLLRQTAACIESPADSWDLALDIHGTPFQRRVWRELRSVPAGSTVSYTDLARRIGEPRAVRAVAQACGANTLAVAIPCHRVIRSDGALAGYRWGIARKRALLDREAAPFRTTPSGRPAGMRP